MPYVLVETCDAVGNKELLAAPATWIQPHANGTTYLRWPNVRNFNMLNALLADDRSPPMAAWERHQCLIKCSNIQSLEMAGKMMKMLQQHWNTSGPHAQKRTIRPEDDEMVVGRVSKKSPGSFTSRQQQQQQQKKVEILSVTEPTVTSLEGLNDPEELQLIGMLDELGSLIKNRHDEARKKLLDGFYRVEKSLQTIVSQAERRIQHIPPAQPMDSEFCVNALTCTEEMDDFEERLKDREYRKQVERWIDCTIGYESNPEYRMRVILDALFDKQFLMKFSWSGCGVDKISFVKYDNIVHLFNYAGTTDTHLATPRYVGYFFKQRLKRIASGTGRKDLSTQAVPCSSMNNKNNTTQKGAEIVSEITIKHSPSDVESSDERPTTAEEFSPVPFTCIVDVDDFEEQLNRVDFLHRVHQWVNENVAYEVSPEVRMMEILYMLFDKSFLPCFTWIGAKKGSYGMVRYINIIKLFQYVGTTAAHRADYAYVENFFMKKLKYAGRRAE